MTTTELCDIVYMNVYINEILPLEWPDLYSYVVCHQIHKLLSCDSLSMILITALSWNKI